MAKQPVNKKKKKSPAAAKKTSVTKKKVVTKKTAATKTVARKKPAKPQKKKVLAIPKGYHSITPYLIVHDATLAIKFYQKAFAAKEMMRMEKSDGKIAHAELKIGDSRIMLADECLDMDAGSPQTYGGSPIGIHLYVKNVDAVVKQAVAAGAKIVKAIEDQFYGDRNATLKDPYGHKWSVSTHIEDVSAAKMKKRLAELHNKHS